MHGWNGLSVCLPDLWFKIYLLIIRPKLCNQCSHLETTEIRARLIVLTVLPFRGPEWNTVLFCWSYNWAYYYCYYYHLTVFSSCLLDVKGHLSLCSSLWSLCGDLGHIHAAFMWSAKDSTLHTSFPPLKSKPVHSQECLSSSMASLGCPSSRWIACYFWVEGGTFPPPSTSRQCFQNTELGGRRDTDRGDTLCTSLGRTPRGGQVQKTLPSSWGDVRTCRVDGSRRGDLSVGLWTPAPRSVTLQHARDRCWAMEPAEETAAWGCEGHLSQSPSSMRRCLPSTWRDWQVDLDGYKSLSPPHVVTVWLPCE